MTMTVRPSAERGHADHGWLDTHHSFSFAHYFDPLHMGFRALRVINEDVIAPATGFGTHGHHDMEIVTYVIDGALEHRDSMGEHSVIHPGEVQRMSAGTGIRHSESNPSRDNRVKLLQIWLLPAAEGLVPNYEQKLFSDEEKKNRLCPIVTADGRNGALTVHQDVDLYASILESGARIDFALRPGRGAWIQMVRGLVTVNGQPIGDGDGLAAEQVEALAIVADRSSEFLLFDLA
ncbi:pirin family protein [Telmatospirillum sp.]|uniref:pirin family protein n=1 Tax=Telmatospirillum sp. TaxID=2079197 RepID=UPI00284CE0A4|nr:pirin family protein [Telmatospirillum sp.]MDR3440100.1 pirin family protein [Telmatospirillum sp.]